MATCLISLGANIGHREQAIEQAISLINAYSEMSACQCSSFFETIAAGGPPDQPRFINAVAQFETCLKPLEVLKKLFQVEQQLGRTRQQMWESRVLDLDLLLYDDKILNHSELILPHPRMILRRFVLEPACEIVADLIHPQTKWTLQQHLDHLNRSAKYICIAGAATAQRRAALEQLKTDVDNQQISILQNSLGLRTLDDQQAAIKGALAAATNMVIANFCPREILASAPEQLARVEQLEQAVGLPRLIVLLDNPNKPIFPAMLNTMTPKGTVVPWLVVPSDDKEQIARELQAAIIAAA
ncbi:MAG: 2-amino-4-hydroxy-6-hydroxymethyldihydropteridine diphosphokinase [Planctomycetaceae bacterium]|jgi:2-amino-4-hydroxy-6-hydroxymethyldihydropteridine diphosphokinase|nr:2-amino-4-hydroxy-6-hydroxymethyldihydropteridine diphosphokinase [Planctomycetaceae bacterium]MBT5125402.1 2-amino-4-hydroxy-6-hydroxymethyldihydropteridine diphosphokinase [Planctomycetaceae bacterium]MBT7253992.1 2-amino-4-hydroxy-6-hydroxymethyldihydropteridine diphosphokinase [Planctomycetaceae bacterium]